MPELQILTVSELSDQIKEAVETSFPGVAVVGEVSNCVRASSGHIYLTLKDDEAQIRGVIWRSVAARLRFELSDGLEVVAAGSVEVYPPRGQYQLIIQELIPKGIGALELAFRQLQEKLAKEGLFDPIHKQPLPRFPRRVALVTSPTGAAVRDMLQVISRRWKGCDIVVVPVAVQGATAAKEIAAALSIVPRLPSVDVVITGRGGGSLEDLWAFNEEIVARAIFECPLPVVSAVGHEIDVTIADLVADARALTPSEAAELVVPQRSEVAGLINGWQHRLLMALRDRVQAARIQLDNLAARRIFTQPLERLHDRTRLVDELAERLGKAVRRHVQTERRSLDGLAETLDSLSPLKVLGRGYSVTRHAANGQVIRDAADIQIDERIETLLAHGRLVSRVEHTGSSD